MNTDLKNRLTDLKSLYDAGLIDEAEYREGKKSLLSSVLPSGSTPPPVSGNPQNTALSLTEGMSIGPGSERLFRLEKKLGGGAMGEVWKAEDVAESQIVGHVVWVAVKALLPLLSAGERHRQALKREAINAKKLSHTNIIRTHDWYEDKTAGGFPFLVMEYLEGQTLDQKLAQAGHFTYTETIDTLGPIVEALSYAWEEHRIVHRDLKPENIYLTAEGKLKLLDFGIAAQARDTATSVGLVGFDSPGTLGYAPPEAGANQKPNPRLDIYALGVLTYELLEGKLPFIGQRSREHWPEKPDALNDAQWQVVRRAIAYDAQERQDSARSYLTELKRAEEDAMRPRTDEERKPQGEAKTTEDKGRRDSTVVVDGKTYMAGEELPPDCDGAPRMVVIPPGRFLMGSPEGVGEADEHPQHQVTISYWLAVARYPVTFEEWDRYVAEVSYAHKPSDAGWGRGRHPVVDVNFTDAERYCEWLSRKTGQPYRLLSESEWEYACRAGTTTECYWGDSDEDIGKYAVSVGNWKTAAVGSKPPNPWGLYDMSGNVLEWVEDCWNEGYGGAPTSGNSWSTGDCSRRVLRGGSWASDAQNMRSAERYRDDTTNREVNIGFRVARTLP